MKSGGSSYNFVASYGRIKTYLDGADTDYVESHTLPSRDSLTFSNGYYAECTALFVDIRKSSDLPAKYNRPKLAKLYRAFVSEMVALMDGSDLCREVNIVGDGVWGVFDTPYTDDVDNVFSTAAMGGSIVKF